MIMRVSWLCAVLAACSSPRMRSAGGGGGGTDGSLGGGDDGGAVTNGAATLPQAIDGAMFVDPVAFPTIPVHVATVAAATTVTVAIDGVATAATLDTGATLAWTASVPVRSLADGAHTVLVSVDGAAAVAARLVAGSQDLEVTAVGLDGNAGTPRLFRDGDHLYATWTDSHTGPRMAWLQQLDGAGSALAPAVALVGGSGQPDVLYARTAFGASTIAVLYQQTAEPYASMFALVGRDGSVVKPAIALDGSAYGAWGGDVVYDGTAGFDATWRISGGSGDSEIEWMHVDETTGAVTGPLQIAAPGHDDPHGNFDPIIDVTVQHAGSASMVSFLRYEYDAVLGEDVDRCQIVVVENGAVVSDQLAENGAGFWWDDDCRILADAGGPALVWPRKDLTSNADNPPDLMVGARAPGGTLASNRGNGAMMVNAPDTREDPWLVATTAGTVMAWSDARSHGSGTSGNVQLFAAPVAADLTTATNIAFASSYVVEGTADVHGAPAGTNAIVTWLDERHGGSVLTPMPEVYLETVWQ